MKRLQKHFLGGILVLAVLGGGSGRTEPAVVAEWDFNDPTTFQASHGDGVVSLLGGVVATNFLGAASDPGKPNGALSLRSFPAQGQASRSAGLEFAVSATGWRDLSLKFEVRASGTANRRLRVLVAVDAGEFWEAGLFELPQDGVFVPASFDLAAIIDLNGAASVHIRLVSEFDEFGEYTGVKPKSDGANSYGGTGTWRFDRVILTGEALGDVNPPWVVQVSSGENQIGLSWPELSGATCTVWRAPNPDGPWEPVASGLEAPGYAELLEAEQQFFRVTSP